MDGLLILAIETACGCGSVALTVGDRVQGRLLAEQSHYPRRSHSRRLLGMVADMLKGCAVTWDDIDAVAVSRGPGSFTGLRIGMAAAKGIAFASGKPLVTVPTLDILAAQLPALHEPVLALLDARKNQVYAAFYNTGLQDETGMPMRLGPYQVCSVASLLDQITEPTICVGPSMADLLAASGQILPQQVLVRMAPAILALPRAAVLGFCAHDLLSHGAGQTDSTPLYVRASEAELNLTAQQTAANRPGPGRVHD